MGCDPEGSRPGIHKLIPGLHWLNPPGLLPYGVDETLVASPDGAGKNVEASMVVAYAREQLLDLRRMGMVDADGYANAATACDFFGGIFQGSRRFIRGLWPLPGCAARDVDSGAGIAESKADAATATAAPPGDDSNFAF